MNSLKHILNRQSEHSKKMEKKNSEAKQVKQEMRSELFKISLDLDKISEEIKQTVVYKIAKTTGNL